jgi:hypothetical protein
MGDIWTAHHFAATFFVYNERLDSQGFPFRDKTEDFAQGKPDCPNRPCGSTLIHCLAATRDEGDACGK